MKGWDRQAAEITVQLEYRDRVQRGLTSSWLTKVGALKKWELGPIRTRFAIYRARKPQTNELILPRLLR